MHRNARGLELAKWRFYFEGGDAGAVVDELQYYQNTDGGFAHALEADCWNPASAPSQMFYAVHILHELDYKDKTHPVIQGMLRYLESGRIWRTASGSVLFPPIMNIRMLHGGRRQRKKRLMSICRMQIYAGSF